jgi:cytochrome c oxidase subunit II
MSDALPPTTPTTPSAPNRAGARGNILRAVLYWAILTVALELMFVLGAPHFTDWQILPPAAGDRSDEINTVLWLFTFLSIPVFAMVVVFALYSAVTWGSRLRPRAEGPATLVSSRLIGWWIAISGVLVVFLYIYGLVFLARVSAQPTTNVLQVHVNGEQWLWNYSYPQYGNVGGSELWLVVNRPVTFTITSSDVQHSFWIPAFDIKQDAVPGETTSISVTPKHLGDFQVRCAELCGIYHAYMQTPVHVVTQDVFNTKVGQLPPAAPPSTAGASSFIPIQVAAFALVAAPRAGATSLVVRKG